MKAATGWMLRFMIAYHYDTQSDTYLSSFFLIQYK